jgi:transcriptional regulator with XRE-family HTH domain
MEVARILERERAAQDISTNALAKQARMSAGQLTRVLNGETWNPGIETVLRILEALGKSLTWLDRQSKHAATK